MQVMSKFAGTDKQKRQKQPATPAQPRIEAKLTANSGREIRYEVSIELQCLEMTSTASGGGVRLYIHRQIVRKLQGRQAGPTTEQGKHVCDDSACPSSFSFLFNIIFLYIRKYYERKKATLLIPFSNSNRASLLAAFVSLGEPVQEMERRQQPV